MTSQVNNQKSFVPIDTALVSLVAIAKFHGIPADINQLRRAYVVDGNLMDTLTMLRASKDIGLKSRELNIEKERLISMPFPAVLQLTNGNYIVVLRAEQERLLIVDPYQDTPVLIQIKNLFNAWEGKIVLFTKRHQAKQEEHKFNLFWFVPVVLKYKKFLGQVLFLSLILQVFGLISPMFTQVIIDKVLVHKSLSTLDVLVIGMIIISLFQTIITGFRSYLFTHTTNKVDVVLSTKLYKHITALQIKYFDKWQVGEVVTRVRELETVRQFITGSGLTIVLDTIFTVVYIFAMFNYSAKLSLIVLLMLPIFILLNIIVVPIYRKRLNDNFTAKTENQAFIIETVTGIEAGKSLAVDVNFSQRWEQMLSRYIKSAFATANLANIAGNIGGFVKQFFSIFVLWYGANLVMKNEITVGELVAFQMLSGQVTEPVLRIVNMWQSFQQTKVSIDRLGDILNEANEASFNPNRTTLPRIKGDIFFDRVSFRYRPDMAEVLYQLNLDITAGMKIGIVGRSGSGKSTLTKMIQRLYLPDSGRILIDGVDLAQVEPAWLRRQIGVVLQDNYLFNGTIAENIAIAAKQASIEEIETVAKISGADEFINKLPNGYNTPVGERGTALSGGQKQRIAIARALITDPKILIFDEATSALDFESEKIIMNNLDKIAQGRTLIMIAHRLSTVQSCDQIIVLDHGRLIEKGKHDELMFNKSAYFNLYNQQMVSI